MRISGSEGEIWEPSRYETTKPALYAEDTSIWERKEEVKERKMETDSRPSRPTKQEGAKLRLLKRTIPCMEIETSVDCWIYIRMVVRYSQYEVVNETGWGVKWRRETTHSSLRKWTPSLQFRIYLLTFLSWYYTLRIVPLKLRQKSKRGMIIAVQTGIIPRGHEVSL